MAIFERSSHGYPALGGLVLMVVQLVAQGDFLLPLFGEGLAVAVPLPGHGSSWAICESPFKMVSEAYHITHKATKAGIAHSHMRLGWGNGILGSESRRSF